MKRVVYTWLYAAMLLVVCLLLPQEGFAQGGVINSVTFGPMGTPKGGVAVTVCGSGATVSGGVCSPALSDATCCFSDSGLTQRLPVLPAPNQLATILSDGLGNYTVWAAPGNYKVSYSGAGVNASTLTIPVSCVPGGTGCTGLGAQLNVANTFTALQTFNAGLTSAGPNTLNGTGIFDGNCIVDGVKNATLAAAVTCAGSSGVIEIPMFAVPALTANVTIPVGVTLRFDGPSGITTTGFTLTINGPIVAGNYQIFFGTGTVSISSPNPLQASWFPGADIFAKANAAAAAYSSQQGQVNIERGVYGSVTTTLQCINHISFWAYGSDITYTGTGKALNCQATSYSGFYGFHILGQQTAGTTCLWIGNNGSGIQTINNIFQDIQCGPFDGFAGTGFDVGVRIDGNSSNNGTYYNQLRFVASHKNLNQGFLIKPTVTARANANPCWHCSAHSNGGDGFQIDGSALMAFIGPDSQVNGGWGYNFPGTLATNGIGILVADAENNTLGDFNDGSAANVSGIAIICPLTTDATPWGGAWGTSANILRVPCSQGTGIQALTESSSLSAFTALATAFISKTANPAATGVVELANADTVCWRNSGNTADVCFSLGGNSLVYNGTSFQGAVVLSSQGSACTNGELVLSAGWQSTGSATVTAAAGLSQTCSWTITTGTTTGANPTVTDNLINQLPVNTVACEMNIHGGTHTAAAGEGFQQTVLSGSAPVFQFNGTPTAGGTTYFVTRRCGP